MATHKEATVKRATPAAVSKKTTKVKKITMVAEEKISVTTEVSASKKADMVPKATAKKKIVVVKKAPAKAKKPVAIPVVVDAIDPKEASHPRTTIHPDAPWPFKKP